MKIGLLGSNGFVGSEIKKELINKKYNFKSIHRLNFEKYTNYKLYVYILVFSLLISNLLGQSIQVVQSNQFPKSTSGYLSSDYSSRDYLYGSSSEEYGFGDDDNQYANN